MRFVVRRVPAAALLVVLVPSPTFVYFAEAEGESEDFGTPEVRTLLSTGVPVDIALMGGALAFGLGLGTAGGALVARHRGRRLAPVVYVLGAVALAAPVAVTAYTFVFAHGARGGNDPVFFVSDAGV